MRLSRFSPITSSEDCFSILEYIDKQLGELSNLVLGETPPVNTLKIFAHYEDEYGRLRQWVDTLGPREDDLVSSTSYYVKPSSPVRVNQDLVDYIGIRVADPYRGQVGCGDFAVDDFDAFKSKYLGKSPFLREMPHQTFEMLELFHPDSDVLGYIVREEQ
jgi:hypothetical protein